MTAGIASRCAAKGCIVVSGTKRPIAAADWMSCGASLNTLPELTMLASTRYHTPFRMLRYRAGCSLHLSPTVFMSSALWWMARAAGRSRHIWRGLTMKYFTGCSHLLGRAT
jgi:hypothetical protein